MTIAFIVLNYNNFEDTKCCISSLLELSYCDKKIIVVDNASPDNSYADLKNLYKDEENVDFIQNEENYGFSKGNNIGCQYAIKKYDADLLCVINNDTYIEDKDFCGKLIEVYKETEFDILAPCVWNVRKNYNQNPFYCPANAEEVEREIANIKRKSKYFKFGAVAYYLASKFYKNEITGKTLSGAACIFSRNYYSKYAEVFIEKTFMYNEEAFLYQRIVNDNLKLVYNNELVIYHSDGKSTGKVYKNKIKKWKFQSEKILLADEILLQYLTENKD